MKFSSVSKSTYRRATGSRVESDRDQNPVKIYLSRSSRSFNERDTTVGIQDSIFLQTLFLYSKYLKPNTSFFSAGHCH